MDFIFSWNGMVSTLAFDIYDILIFMICKNLVYTCKKLKNIAKDFFWMVASSPFTEIENWSREMLVNLQYEILVNLQYSILQVYRYSDKHC